MKGRAWCYPAGMPRCNFELRAHRAWHDRFLAAGDTAAGGFEAFQIDDPDYADDIGTVYTSGVQFRQYVPLLYPHFQRFGMEIHKGDKGMLDIKGHKSKSEGMFVPAAYRTYLTADTTASPPTFVSKDGITVDLSDVLVDEHHAIPIVSLFTYLGNLVTMDCKDEGDVDARIKKASAAFGALSQCLFKPSDITPRAKGLAYKTLVLSILLYGSESWALKQTSWNKLRVFHNDCVRRMCRATRHMQWQHHLSNKQLRSRLHLEEIEVYVYKRQLAWLEPDQGKQARSSHFPPERWSPARTRGI